MKYRIWFLLAALGVSLTFLPSCINSYRADIEKILSPGALPYLKDSKLIQVSSHDTTGGNNDMITMAAGREATILHVAGPGVITRIWFRIDSDDPYYLRRILLKIYWDKENDPSVEVPLGDFFGSGFAYKQYVTSYLGMPSGGYTCFFPMPFEDWARIVIVNETGLPLKGFYYQIDYQKLESPIISDIGYFHAYWHRDVSTDYDSNFTVLKTRGRGHVVGVNMSIQSYDRSFSFLDGNEEVYVDGEKKPSIRGTGTEDYFSSGWYFNKGEYAGPYNGLILKDDSLGRISAYRFHIPDPIPFKKSLNFTIEHGFNNSDIADYSSTVYWYQVEPNTKFPPILKSGLRIPLRLIPEANLLEAEKLTFNLGKIRAKVMDMSDYGAEWGGNKQLLIESGPGDDFSLNLNRLEENGYNIRIYYTRGPDYGNADVYIGSEKVGHIRGYAPFIQPGGYITINNFNNLYNNVFLQFVVTGKDSISSGYSVGLDGIKLEPKRTIIQAWNLIGPFPDRKRGNDTRAGMDSIFPPETAININHVYPGLNGKPVRWKVLKPESNGFVSFGKMINPDQPAVFYALTYIYSPVERTASLMIGADDAIKVFYNNNKPFAQRGGRSPEPDQGRSFIKVNKGWNKLLLKIENRAGKAGFYARILDRENLFRYYLKQEIPAETTDLPTKIKKLK
jgi:hypothetical protein